MKIIRKLATSLTIGALALHTATAAADDPKPFVAGSLAAIEESYAGEQFILVLWQIDCAPCHREMIMLGEVTAANPDANVVLVGTDSDDMLPVASELIERYGVSGIETWYFADSNAERLRFEIDPDWYGELPRNYFYAADGTRTGKSGTLDEDRVRDWLSLD